MLVEHSNAISNRAQEIKIDFFKISTEIDVNRT